MRHLGTLVFLCKYVLFLVHEYPEIGEKATGKKEGTSKWINQITRLFIIFISLEIILSFEFEVTMFQRRFAHAVSRFHVNRQEYGDSF